LKYNPAFQAPIAYNAPIATYAAPAVVKTHAYAAAPIAPVYSAGFAAPYAAPFAAPYAATPFVAKAAIPAYGTYGVL